VHVRENTSSEVRGCAGQTGHGPAVALAFRLLRRRKNALHRSGRAFGIGGRALGSAGLERGGAGDSGSRRAGTARPNRSFFPEPTIERPPEAADPPLTSPGCRPGSTVAADALWPAAIHQTNARTQRTDDTDLFVDRLGRRSSAGNIWLGSSYFNRTSKLSVAVALAPVPEWATAAVAIPRTPPPGRRSIVEIVIVAWPATGA